MNRIPVEGFRLPTPVSGSTSFIVFVLDSVNNITVFAWAMDISVAFNVALWCYSLCGLWLAYLLYRTCVDEWTKVR